MRHVVYELIDIGTWTCWAIVGAVWVAAALAARPGAQGARPAAPAAPAAHEGRDLASLIAGAAGAIIVLMPASAWKPLALGLPWLRLTGLAVLLVAAGGAVWSRLTLGDMWSSAPITKPAHALRTGGPYAITRHPIYTAILGMLVGTALTQGLGRWVALVIVVTVILIIKTRAEERLLSRQFPEEYRRYRRRVPQLIPGLRRPRSEHS